MELALPQPYLEILPAGSPGEQTTDKSSNPVLIGDLGNPGSDVSGVPATTDSSGNPLPVTTDEAGNTIPIPTGGSGNPGTDASGTLATTDSSGNPLPATTDKSGNPVPTGGPGNPGTDASGIPATTDSSGNPLPVTTDEAGNTIPVTTGAAGETDISGIPTATDASGNPVPVSSDKPGNTVPVSTDESGNPIVTDTAGNPVPVSTDEAGNPIPVSTDETGNPVVTDTAGNPIPISTDEAGNTVPVSTDEAGNTIPVSTDEAGNTVPATTDDAGNTIPATSEAGNTLPVTTDEAGNTIPVTTDEVGNTIPATTDEAGNTIPVTTGTGNTLSATTDEVSNTVPVSTDEAGNTIPVTTGAENTLPVTTDEAGSTIPVSTDEAGNTLPVTTDEASSTASVTASGSDVSGTAVPTTDEAGNTVSVTSSGSDVSDTTVPTTDGEQLTTNTSGQQSTDGPEKPTTAKPGETTEGPGGPTTKAPGEPTTKAPEETEGPTSISTITTLPPSVTLSPVTDTTFTTPVLITTTSPGSDQPTVVPVIVPPKGKGPPEVCWGCPPNVKIDTDDFCVEIIGTKIGDCSDDDEDDDDDDDDDNEPSSTEKESSSCTTSVVATYQSVFCSVTGTETAEPTCALNICTDDSCSRFDFKRSLNEPAPAKLQKRRGNPGDGEWVNPIDFPGANLAERQKELVMSEVNDAYRNRVRQDAPGEFTPEIVWFPPASEDTTSNYILFKEKTNTLALQGLWGCTSVVVVSERGAWASHIWESAWQEHFAFYNHAIGKVHVGSGNQDDKYHRYGIDQLMNSPGNGEAGVMFGDSSKGLKPSDLGVHVYVMAPRHRPDPRFDAEWNPLWTDEQLASGTLDPGGQGLMYGDRVNDLVEDLREAFGDGVGVEVIQYSPLVLDNGDMMDLMLGLFSREEMIEKLGDVRQNSARGKALIQYHPAKTCAGWAEWRVWFEGRNIDGRKDSWGPTTSQLLVRSGGNQKREECPEGNPDREGSPSDSASFTLPPLPTLTGIIECASSTEVEKCLSGLCVTTTSCLSFGSPTGTATTTTDEPAATTEGSFCSSDDECDGIECEKGEELTCLRSKPGVITGTCTCQKPADPEETCKNKVPKLTGGEGKDEECRCYFESEEGADPDFPLVSFPKAAFDDAIDHFCNGDFIDRTDTAGKTSKFQIASEGLTIYMDVTRDGVSQEGCDWAPTQFFMDSYCRRSLEVLTSCNVLDDEDRTKGGNYIDNDKYGCINWTLYATSDVPEGGSDDDDDDDDDDNNDDEDTCPNEPPKISDISEDDESCRCYSKDPDAVTWPTDNEEDAIEGLCGGTPVDQNRSETGTYSLTDDLSLDYRVSRVDVDQEGCSDQSDMDRDQWSEYCTKALGVLTACQLINNNFETRGVGGKFIDNSEYGCIEWELFAREV
ncbi:hypothetical protein ACHAPT_006038 [Fusarium lateritium]